MTLNGHFALKSVSGLATDGLASAVFGQLTVRKFAELPIYCHRQNCSPGNVVSGTVSIYLCRYSRGLPGEGASNESVVVENSNFRFFRSLYSEYFTYIATRKPLRDATVDDLGDISRSLDCFTSNFTRTVRDTAKVTIDY